MIVMYCEKQIEPDRFTREEIVCRSCNIELHRPKQARQALTLTVSIFVLKEIEVISHNIVQNVPKTNPFSKVNHVHPRSLALHEDHVHPRSLALHEALLCPRP